MAFVLKKSNTFKWPITVNAPVDGGTYKKVSFDLEFKDLTQSRMDDIFQLSNDGNLSATEIAREIVVGWAGIEDDDGSELPFSIAGRDMLLDVPLMAATIVETYLEIKNEAKRKN
tara:strand:- start:687 stop:1031 length:345 start_codon:yes stop_codon:yes gene_type:complete